MTVEKLRSLISSEGLKIIDCDEDSITVCYKNGREVYTKICVNEIGNVTQEELVEIIQGKRDSLMLKVITRVVGYYSNVENWNRSKIGELEDRRKGSYALETPFLGGKENVA